MTPQPQERIQPVRFYLPMDKARQVYALVSELTGVSIDAMLSERRDNITSRARAFVMYGMRALNASNHSIGLRMQLDPSSVSYGLSKLEEQIECDYDVALLAAKVRTALR